MKAFLLSYFIIINIVSFCLVWLDKRAAIVGKFRVPNYVWWLLAIVGGSVFEYLAMRMFHHKTLKKSYMIGIPAIMAAQIAVAVWIAMHH